MTNEELCKHCGLPEKEHLYRLDGRKEWGCKHGVGHTCFSNNNHYTHGCDGCCKEFNTQDNKAFAKNSNYPETFNLSSKIHYLKEEDAYGDWLKGDDVKEFIRRLKKTFKVKEANDKRAMLAHSLSANRGKYELEVIADLIREIDSLAGEELVK